MLQQNDINNIQFPRNINIIRTSGLAVAPINTFSLAIGLFMFAAPLMDWCNFRATSLGVAFACGGICQYIIGIFNWYQNKTVQCFIDFMFSFLHFLISYFMYTYEPKNGQDIYQYFENYMIATFFILILVALLTLGLASIKKGIIHLVYLGLLILSDIFIIVWLYHFKRKPEKIKMHNRLRKTAGYFLFFSSLALWYTGVGRFINEFFKKKDDGSGVIPLIDPDF